MECIVNRYAVRVCIAEEVVPAVISASDVGGTSIREIRIHPAASGHIEHGPVMFPHITRFRINT